VVTICATSCNIRKFYCMSLQCFMCFARIWEQIDVIYPYNVK
jgi:hypothetical protein